MIYGERIRLRAPERTDVPLFVAWLNDPDVRSGLALFLPLSSAEEEKWFDGMLSHDASEHPLTIEVREGDGWKPIGNCGFHTIEWRCHSTEVGIVIGEKAYWNRGYGTEAMRLMLKHGFETLNLNRIWLRVHDDNPGAIRAYEKAGYIHEGRFRQAEFKDGRYKDVICMSVLRSEWKG